MSLLRVSFVGGPACVDASRESDIDELGIVAEDVKKPQLAGRVIFFKICGRCNQSVLKSL